ncbi:MAG: MBL fold metallo-hydrolase [Anaerolineales bacterium]|nr:MBL fold metallo-hydrolase [Anaerolineales bacterium]
MDWKRFASGVILSVFGLAMLLACAAELPQPTLTQPAPPSPTPTTAAPTAVPTPNLPIQIDLSAELTIRQIRPDVYVITHSFPWPANSLLVEMENDTLVLVDTPYTPEATQQVLDWFAERLGQREIIAINTGFHTDNLGGNAYLVAQNIPVYGSELTAQLLEERGETMRADTLAALSAPQDIAYYQAHKMVVYTPPTYLFDLAENPELKIGDEGVQIYYPGASQAPDKLAVYFPGQKLLFGSCMVIGWEQVGNTADADLNSWPDAVRALSQFDAQLVIPGHGERLDPDLLAHTIALLADFQE